ncbi:MAG: hypothetical protein OXH47_07845, partial [Paracoccaceae bacterium]|nr:hypothetical protein [Paracoccaceae bacterium]
MDVAENKRGIQLPVGESTDDQETVSGTVKRIVFYNPENGYHILRITLDRGKFESTVVGVGLGTIEAGTHITAYGKWIKDPKYGKQFKAQSIQSRLPTQPDAIEKYLASGIFPGIGKILAARIVKMFGNQIFEVLEKEPQKLAKVRGLSKTVSDNLVKTWDSQKEESQVTIFLHEFGLSKSVIRRIIKRYGYNTYNAMKENPYQLIENIWGIAFTTADDIAKKVGIERDDPRRIKAGLNYTLQLAAQNGSCGLILSDLLSETEVLLNVSRDAIYQALKEEVQSGALVVESQSGAQAVFLKYYFDLENLVAKLIKRKNQGPPVFKFNNFQRIFQTIEHNSNIVFSEQQREAIK